MKKLNGPSEPTAASTKQAAAEAETLQQSTKPTSPIISSSTLKAPPPTADSDASQTPPLPTGQSSLTERSSPQALPPSSSSDSSSDDNDTSTSSCLPAAFLSSPPQQSLTRILSTLASDLDGCLALGADCVLRSLSARREVLDAVGLEPEMVRALGERMGMGEEELGVRIGDGTRVPREKWFEPEEGLLPEGEEGEVAGDEGIEEGSG